ncbi:MAG: hypothetical protein Q9160_005741 [Pyrenula sp. 1 TL-2023]
MRPPRLLVLLLSFIALPTFLTFLSLLTAHPRDAESANLGDESRSSRLRALFSFHAPISLFPPSAIIRLTDDNSTFFLARPAGFGPLLPGKGLSGRLWVGSGFGEDTVHRGGFTSHLEGELGCSDVPGWGEGDQKSTKNIPRKALVQTPETPKAEPVKKDKRGDGQPEEQVIPKAGDGTDDHLHHPLPESDSAKNGKAGEPAELQPAEDKTKPPTHADIQSLQESAEIAGKVVLLSRGGCGFLEKAKWVQRRGGIALIVGDTSRGAPLIQMNARGDTSNITIPALFTSHTTAHLLSSLIPPETEEGEGSKDEQADSKGVKKGSPGNDGKQPEQVGPNFTPARGQIRPTGKPKPTLVPASSEARQGEGKTRQKKGWLRSVLAAVGIGGDSSYAWHMPEDSRRPPSSGNIDWVLENWDDDEASNGQTKTSSKITAPDQATNGKAKDTKEKNPKVKQPKTKAASGDDFVIGVQDWRDPDILASVQQKATPKATTSTTKSSNTKPTNQANAEKQNLDKDGKPNALKGGSITPGSGEYGDVSGEQGANKPEPVAQPKLNKPNQKQSTDQGKDDTWLDKLGWSSQSVTDDEPPRPLDIHKPTADKMTQPGNAATIGADQDSHEGLWVTLSPAAMSTSPFFDTLLVLVVSPLVTLTFVYALLLLRSRIRRRRWRAPKSVVDRLPVRTYHTISSSSSTTSLTTPHVSSPTSPLLRSIPRSISQSRPRSQHEKPTSETFGSSFRRKYTGRQVECVVCLEEYVDGLSRVMSLPCGHEFHAECITPWLTTRRRTCPICKGDVVRSMAQSSSSQSYTPISPSSSLEDIQNTAVVTRNDEPTAAIPIEDDHGYQDDYHDYPDLEHGDDDELHDDSADEPLMGPRSTRAQRQGRWRDLANRLSLSAWSGETAVWGGRAGSASVDRNR